ncbi:hypothetical protein ACOMHN_036318 [Nucella lapillus]
MMGRKECVQLLLAHNAPVKVKNTMGWTPLAEAISYGNRQTIVSVLRKLKQQARDALDQRRPSLIQALRDMDDFYLEFKWDFNSWVPLVSRMLPSDVCKIYKKGTCIRLDTTLVDFNNMHWERGDISFIFNGSQKPQHSLTVMDNRLGVYQKIRYEENDACLDEEVSILMSSDVLSAQMSYKSITFSRAQHGWLFREDKTAMVGGFKADFYFVNGLTLQSKKRREHLSPEEVQKNKAILENIGRGSWDQNPTRILGPEPNSECGAHYDDIGPEPNSECGAHYDNDIGPEPNSECGAHYDNDIGPEPNSECGAHYDNDIGPEPNSECGANYDNDIGPEPNSECGAHDNDIGPDPNSECGAHYDNDIGPEPNSECGAHYDNDIGPEPNSECGAHYDNDIGPEPNSECGAHYDNDIGRGSWDQNPTVERRPSVSPPPQPRATWNDYIQAPAGRPPCLARTLNSKESSKAFKATVAMSEEFPMTVEIALDVLEVVAPFKQFQKLRDFMMTKLPSGFPVKIDIPVFPTITAMVTFTLFEWRNDLETELFQIPADFREDAGRFPDL